ncbi:MAG: DUF2169 domain-containing protein [Polyangiaceae bacterium]|nr:DUF2169 domain-containing protein [Polyangiaceae bacterium]
MKVVKPTKLPILHRVVEVARKPQFHVAAIMAFPLSSPRALLDELAFWAATGAALGENAVFDESLAKCRGEFLVCGGFFAPGNKPIPASYVRARVGGVDKRLAITGDRTWQNNVPTAPQPITTMPVDWAHAFGGSGFDRNPYGKGAVPLTVNGQEGVPLPNVEPYGNMMRSPKERPDPAGFLPMDVTFIQRRSRSGTYDKRYLDEFFPGFPSDIDPTFFNVAPPDQWASGYFAGDEEFIIENMHPTESRLEGRLPGLTARVIVTHKTPAGEHFREIPLQCDTVWLFPAVGLGAVVFHGVMPVADDDAADIVHLVAAVEELGRPRPVEHYQQALTLRLDKDKGAVKAQSDSDLMPDKTSGVVANLKLTDMDVGRWTRSENLALKRGRLGQVRHFANARARVEAEGLDPKEFGFDKLPPPPEEPPLDDLDALAEYMEKQLKEADSAQKDLQAKTDKAKEQARRLFAEMGKNYDEEMAKAEKEGGGPPKFSAAEHLAKLSATAGEAAAQGIPMDEFDRQVNDPRVWAELKAQEAALREMYVKFGHLQPTARGMDPDSAERVRTLVQLAQDENESLSRRDFTGANLAGMKLPGLDMSGSF